MCELELELNPLLELESQQIYTSHSGAFSSDLSAPHSNSSRNAGNTIRSPSRVGQRDNNSTVPVMPLRPPGQPELEPLLEDEELGALEDDDEEDEEDEDDDDEELLLELLDEEELLELSYEELLLDELLLLEEES